MKKAILAVLVAAFGYNCAMAQAPSGRVINSKQGPVVKAPRSSENQTVSNTARPAAKHPHIKPYTGKKNIKGANANMAKPKQIKPAPRPGKGHHYGQYKHHGKGKHLGQSKPVCSKPAQPNNGSNRGGMQLQNNSIGMNRPAQQPAQQNNSMQRSEDQRGGVQQNNSNRR